MAVAFPAFLKLEHQRDGSAKASFLAEVASITGDAKAQFQKSFGEISRIVDTSLSGIKGGQFGLKFDIPGLKQAAADAQFARERLIAVRDAAVSLAASTGDTSRETQTYIAALRAQVIEAERAAQAAQSQATTYERLQAELDKTVAGNQRLAESYRQVQIAKGASNSLGGGRGPDTRSALDRLLAGQASVDRAAVSATTLEQVLGRVTRAYSDVGAAADGATQAVKRGTEANHLMVNSTRSLRLATIQAGQQIQDIGISLYSGQRAAVVFAQQLPQLAFALTGLEGSANKTHDRIGQFATFLSGPWGLAVGLAVGAGATLIASLLGVGDEEEKTRKKSLDLIDVLKDMTSSWDDLTEAVGRYNKQQREAGQTSLEAVGETARGFSDQINRAIKDIAKLEKLRDAANARAERRYDPATGGYVTTGRSAAGGAYQAEIDKIRSGLPELTAAARRAVNAVAVERAKLQTDSAHSIEEGFKKRREEVAALGLSVAEATKRYADLARQEKAALDALNKSGQARSEAANRQFGREINIGEARSIAERAGFRVTSGARTFAEQQHLYNTVRTAENPVAVPGTSAHERGNALDIAFGAGVTPASIKKAFAEEGVRLTKILRESGHFHVEFSTAGADKAEREADRIADAAQRAQEQLQQFGERSAEAIARVNERFNEQPRLIDQAAQATRQLDAIMADLAERKPPGFEQMIADAQAAKGAIADALVRPFQELERDSERRIGINRLLAQGREDEADALQTIWQLEDTLYPLSAARKEQVFAIAAAERAASEELAKQQEIVGAYLDATRSIRGEIEAILSGDGKFGNFKRIFKQLQGKILFEQIFGDVFRDLEKTIRRSSGIDVAVDKLASDTKRAGDAALDLASALTEAAAQIRSGDASAGSVNAQFDSVFGRSAANDNAASGIASGIGLFTAAAGRATAGRSAAGGINGDEIVVVGRPARDTLGGLTPASYGEIVANAVTRPLLRGLDQLIPGLSGVIGGALGGYVTGGVPGGIIGALKGIKGLPEVADKLFKTSNVLGKAGEGAAVGTAAAGIMKSLGIKTSTTGAQIGGAIGSFLPIPGGQIIGAIAGGLIGGLFKKAKTGTATLSVGADGLGVGSLGGSSASRRKAAGGLGDSVADSINRIAEQLGGSADGPISVSIGIRDKNFRVDPTGRGNTKKSKGAIDFGQDQEAALKFAVAEAIRDGVITGLRAGTQRLIQGGDIEKQLQKALDFEGVFTRLRARTDPVGAAIEALNKEFTRLQSVFAEAGASAAEYADLEKLYTFERADAVKQAMENVGGSLRSLLDDLTVGNDALSLRDRKAAAQAKYDPLAARLAAGDLSASDDFAEAARALLDIERQFSGSQSGYFTLLDQVKGLSGTALDAVNNIADAAAGRDSPFSKSSVTANDNQGVIDAIETGNAMLTAVNDNLGILIQQGLLNQTGLISRDAVNYF